MEAKVKKIYLSLLAVSFLFVASVTISAHDFWLVPKKFRISTGDSLIILANTGMGELLDFFDL